MGLLVLLDPGLPLDIPQVSINPIGGVTSSTASLSARINDTGGENITERGFEVGMSPISDPINNKFFKENGSYGVGDYAILVSGLNQSTTYYYRAYVKNRQQTGYSEWFGFTTYTFDYAVTIDGVDRTADIIFPSLKVYDQLNDQQNTCTFRINNRSGLGLPQEDQEVRIEFGNGLTLFGGYIVEVIDNPKIKNGNLEVTVTCIDYVRLMDSNLVHRVFENMTAKAIIEAIVQIYCIGQGITTTNVATGPTISQISFNYLQPSQCIRKLCEHTGYNWYLDYEKDLHFFPLETNVAPFNIDANSANYRNLKITKDASQIKNRVYVRGGTKLSDFTTYSTKGDGALRKFVLPDKPHDVSLTVNGVSKSVGIKNVDTTGFDWYLNFQEKYIEQDDAGTVLSTSDTMELTYKYDIPILVALENQASIIAHGQKEFAIFDKSITTTQAARDRANAELTDYANKVVEGEFETLIPGFVSGQYMHITSTERGIDDDYIVQKVVSESMGGGMYYYTVSIASSKTVGIIRFLIQLLEANKNLIELDDNEVIDELYNISDALLSDSLQEALTIDSTGPYFTWCPDTPTSEISRMRWDLFQWK